MPRHLSHHRRNVYNFAFIYLLAHPINSLAQDIQNRETNNTSDEVDNITDEEIIVTAERIKGSVISETPPVAVLDEDDIASYGASSIQELLTAIGPQTGSSRGPASGPPIVLINAQRVSGFRELRNIPPEAIVRVEIFPEEVALQYGFKPDQRVINFILKDNFQSASSNGSYGLSTSGGYNTSNISATYTKFSKKTRFNADIFYGRSNELTEDERDIVQEGIADNIILAGPIDPQDIGQFRTLLPESDTYRFNSNYSRALSKTTRLSLNLAYEHRDNISLFGLNSPIFTLPSSNQFTPATTDILIQRLFIEPRPLQSINNNDTIEGGASLNGVISNWRWSSTNDIRYNNSISLIDQNSDFSTFQQLLLNGDNIDPFSTILDPNIGEPNIIATNTSTININNSNTLSGTLLTLPTGEVTTTFRAGYNYSRIDSESDQTGSVVKTILSRNDVSFGNNIDIPIIDDGAGIGKILGDLSINANSGIRNISNFDTLFQYGYGITWNPSAELTLSFTAINEDTPPSLAQLGNPISITPNIPIFDFTQSITSFVELTSGGNPDLLPQKQRDIKISLNYSPKKIENFNLIADYSRNRSFDTSNAFPLLTPEIEAAFSNRVTRDANGTLIAIDRTPVTYDRVASDRIRYGFSFSKRLGASSRGRPRGISGGRPGAGQGTRSPNIANRGARFNNENPRNSSDQKPRTDQSSANSKDSTSVTNNQNTENRRGASARSGRPTSRRGGGLRRPGRINISLFHTIALNESILISEGVTELDLLNGSAVGNNGGAVRHNVELEAGIFNNGIGARVSANYRSGSTVDGDIFTGSPDIRFGALATANFSLFFNLSDRKKLTKALPFLKNSRVSFRVSNITNSIQNITDSSGEVPRNFQSGFVDPIGRFFSFSFRKSF